MAREDRKVVLLVHKQSKDVVYLTKPPALAGFDILFNETGAGAIKRTTECRPGIVLLDIGLLDMDGIDVVRAVRDNLKTARTPIIAISACASNKAKWLDNGCDVFIQKPVEVLDLITQVKKLARR